MIRSRWSAPHLLTRVWRSAHALWFPAYDLVVPRRNNVLAILGTPEGRRMIPACNIVTDAGDIWYAQKAVGETVTNVFGEHECATAGTPGKAATRASFTPGAAGSKKAHDSTYPKRNDTDADNPGAGVDVVTFRVSYTTTDFNQTAITHWIITNAAHGASEPLLTGFAITSFNKTATDTLKLFVNHTMSGV